MINKEHFLGKGRRGGGGQRSASPEEINKVSTNICDQNQHQKKEHKCNNHQGTPTTTQIKNQRITDRNPQ
jgi:hypothetical protein